jgi:ABC-type nitrate/sulfonate/bicarbonate transport system ATPase subunit
MYTTNETLLYVNDLSAGYDGKAIIKNINILEKDVIRESHDSTGQVIAVLGRSGRGKSTLFKVLTGLLEPMSGTALINNPDNKEFNSCKPIKEGDICFVNQKYSLFRHKTVLESCRFAMRKVNLPKTEKDKIIEDYLIQWELFPHKDKYPNELSGGQRQRTAIIEKMLTNKHFIILDEPFSGLDVINIEKVKEYFKKIGEAHEHNTIMFSTHDIKLAVELADSIYVIGFPEGKNDYSTVVKHYDLKQMGLAWKDYSTQHELLLKDIKNVMSNS